MFVHLFQIILNFLHVCESVSWLTSLLKLHKYRDISSSGWDIFLKFFGDIPEMLVHWFQIILIFCMSISLAVGILPYKYRNISCSGPDVNLIFGRYSWDVGTLATNDSEFHVCLSVCLFAYILTKIRQRDIFTSGWYIFLEFFGDIPEMLVH